MSLWHAKSALLILQNQIRDMEHMPESVRPDWIGYMRYTSEFTLAGLPPPPYAMYEEARRRGWEPPKPRPSLWQRLCRRFGR